MDYSIRILELENQLESYPPGYITRKKINGHIYYYHQWKENGRTRSFVVHDDELAELREKIEERKSLEKELRQIKKTAIRDKSNAMLLSHSGIPVSKPIASLIKEGAFSDNGYYSAETAFVFKTNVIFGDALSDFASQGASFAKRDCFGQIRDYLYSDASDTVCLLYGLRRTGKTTLMRQLLLEMKPDEIAKTAYIKLTASDNVAGLNQDLKLLRSIGFKYIFLDEVTLLEDFIGSASLFSDVYAAQGMKFVLSGTDSLSFYFAMCDELYDRAVAVHTTWIPYREHARLLGIREIDDYIRYGGTLRAGETSYEDNDAVAPDASFRDDESTRRYIDTAISRNIQHSLECFKDGRHFRHLMELYQKDELTNAINRIIQSINHEFTTRVITEDFRSRDLGSAAQILRKASDPSRRTDVLDRIDLSSAVSVLMRILDIRNKEDLKTGITSAHVYEIKEYLRDLELISAAPVETMSPHTEPMEHIIFTQPGMRFCQAQALVYSLMKDPVFTKISEGEKLAVTETILNDVRGIMLEDLVLFETQKSLTANKRCFKLLFDAAEFDMVIYDRSTDTCELYEIKHSKVQDPGQAKHLLDEDLLHQTEKRFGRITKRCILYTGASNINSSSAGAFSDGSNSIVYENVEEYLKAL